MNGECERCAGTGQRLIAGAESGLECPDCTGSQEPKPCEMCDGAGSFWKKEEGGSLSGSRTLCPQCLGTKVQP